MINREIIYERNVTGSCMKIPEGPNPGLDERLMLKGKLKGTLPVEKTYIDGGGQYWYNISGKQSLDSYCRMKQIGISFVERLVISICSELEILEWNLIHTSCLMLDPELVFITNSNKEFIFTLYPGNSSPIESEFQQLMEYLLTRLDHKDEAAVRAAYGIYERTLEEGYSIMDIRDFIVQTKEEEQTDAVLPAAGNESAGRRQEAFKRPQEVFKKPQEAFRKPQEAFKRPQEVFRKPQETFEKRQERGERPPAGRLERPLGKGRAQKKGGLWQKLWEYVKGRAGGGESAVLAEAPVVYPQEEVYIPQEEIYPTVCLSSFHGAPRGILLYQGMEQFADIPLAERVVKIGHGREADARIDRDTISQLHAKIDRDGDCFYIEDLNSTNGTCVNDEALVYKERRKLKVNDIVQFADVRYRFC
ncbi:MAG: FHA domain-containing protein [Muribaculaceae bacterium]|nr:FHA domain-containing protein [Roseburia sp.]MCM1430902.1 FHA domain-containing protein [Muribaculaceae bacterium]MCM1491737.1 FHA domain-containing protein [Muribaculaceae bacterium]